MTHPHALSTEQLADFDRDGYLVLRGIVPSAVIDDLRDVFAATVDRLAAQWKTEGFIEDACEELPFETRFAALRSQLPSRFPTSWRKTLVSPTVYSLWQLPELVGPLRSLLGDELYAHGVWNGRPREPHNSMQKVLWHQDAHYFRDWDPADGGLVSVWMPLVPVTATSGCLEMAVGSHKRGWIARLRGSNGLFTVADEDLEGFERRAIEMEPGDALMFTDTTLHQSLDNVADHVRWSIDIRFGQATPNIISKTPRGYHCFSASDPSKVEPIDVWADRYDYDKFGLDAEIEDFDSSADLDEAARSLGMSRSELEVF